MTDKEIMHKLRKRDAEVFEYIASQYNKLLWAVAGDILGRAGMAEDIEDCISDVYVKLLENPRAYDARKGPIKPYLVRLVKNRALDKYRTLSRAGTVPDWETAVGEAADPLSEVVRKEEAAQIQEVLRVVGEPDREILVRRYFYGEKPMEIARAMRLEKKRVENRLYQGKRKLRNMLDRKGEGL